MTALIPRLDREDTRRLIEEARGQSVSTLAERMPVRGLRTRSSPLGGLQLADADLVALRTEVLELAHEHGYPGDGARLPSFDAKCARVIHQRLRVSAHEASEDDAWSYVTCAWLLDVAAWRWGGVGESDRRFRGDVNRNTFRRLWWRAEVLGADIDLALLGEDELVNIMERPTIAANRRLARTLAVKFLESVGDGGDAGRMMLMREAGKRLVRLTPILDFFALSDAELAQIVDAVLAAAADGGNVAVFEEDGPPIAPSDMVERAERLAPVAAPRSEEGPETEFDTAAVEEYREVALGIAGRTGRVTNSTLREVVPLEPADARRLLQSLVESGALSRRGKAKGTYYVLPGDQAERDDAESLTAAEQPLAADAGTHPEASQPESALRRFLSRRG